MCVPVYTKNRSKTDRTGAMPWGLRDKIRAMDLRGARAPIALISLLVLGIWAGSALADGVVTTVTTITDTISTDTTATSPVTDTTGTTIDTTTSPGGGVTQTTPVVTATGPVVTATA